MKNKKLVNKIKLGFGMMLCAIAVLSSPCVAITSYAAGGDQATVYTHYREWVYKIMDGKMYKALYNATTGQYETDWIYVCDWPPEE